MITTQQRVAAAFSGRRRGVVVWMVVLLGGCATEGETTLARTARALEVGAMRAERLHLERQLEVLRQTDGQQARDIQVAKASAVRTGASLQAVLAELHGQLELVRRAEIDLEAARARGRQIELELAPLRALELQLAQQERRRVELEAQLASGSANVAALEQQLQEQAATLLPRLGALQRQVEAARRFGAVVDGAEKAVVEALAQLVPPPVAPVPPQAPAIEAPR